MVRIRSVDSLLILQFLTALEKTLDFIPITVLMILKNNDSLLVSGFVKT